jgi:predicted XRE-type DNA-binding protein
MKKTINNIPPKQPIVRGNNNVFTDLGFSPNEAADLAVKAELTRQILNRIKAMSMTQAQAARRLGVSQPDVSRLMNGHLTRHSVERLLAMLNALSVDIDIVVRVNDRDRRQRPGVMRVREVPHAA